MIDEILGRIFVNQTAVLVIVTVVLVLLISDIDRPSRGMIGVCQQPLIDLLDSIKQAGK